MLLLARLVSGVAEGSWAGEEVTRPGDERKGEEVRRGGASAAFCAKRQPRVRKEESYRALDRL